MWHIWVQCLATACRYFMPSLLMVPLAYFFTRVLACWRLRTAGGVLLANAPLSR